MKHQLIAIAGPPCSGKSASGAILAELLSVNFLETDHLVEETQGRTISWIFKNLGEAAFRALENQAVKKAVSSKALVIALGGGTLLDLNTRKLVEAQCRIFTLWATPETLVSRNTGGRPLAVSEEMLYRLLRERKEHYASLPGRLCTDGKTPRQVATIIAGILRKEDPSL